MPPSDDSFLEAGFACAQLIAEPKSWINRRVETVEMLSQEETRRRVSVDFTLSAKQREALTTRHGVVVPISVLSKHPRPMARSVGIGSRRATSSAMGASHPSLLGSRSRS